MAEDYGLDLVEVRPQVYKILDIGKLTYEASKHKQPKVKPVKEMKFKLNIGPSDYDMKIKHIMRFLQSGHTVKVTIWFSGREVSRPEMGVDLMCDICESLAESGTTTVNPNLNGKNMTMVIDPFKVKK